MPQAQPVSHDDDMPDDSAFDRLANVLADFGLNFAQATWAARIATRWNVARIRRDAELHCRVVLAMQRFTVSYEELHPSQQNAINRDVKTVINVFSGRMTDHDFLFLGGDQRDRLQPERKVREFGGVQ